MNLYLTIILAVTLMVLAIIRYLYLNSIMSDIKNKSPSLYHELNPTKFTHKITNLTLFAANPIFKTTFSNKYNINESIKKRVKTLKILNSLIILNIIALISSSLF